MVVFGSRKRWDRWHIIPQLGVYTTYSPCLLGGEKCYRSHLLWEPETTTIDSSLVFFSARWKRFWGGNPIKPIGLIGGLDVVDVQQARCRDDMSTCRKTWKLNGFPGNITTIKTMGGKI